MSFSKLLLVAASLFVVVGRFLIEPRLDDIPSFNLSYEAFAHLFVGGLLGAFVAAYRSVKWGDGRRCLWLALALSLFELDMFIFQTYFVK